MKKLACLSLVLTLSISVGQLAAKEYYIGCIDDMRGDVKIHKASRDLWIIAKRFVPVEENDTIKTGKLSFCRLLFDDGTALRLEASSQLKLETLKLIKREKDKVQSYKFKVDFGILLSVFNRKKAKAAKFRVRTPTAVMAIRGTDFAVSVKGDETEVGLFEGDLVVTNPDVEGEEVVLKPDQEATIKKGEKPDFQGYLSRLMIKQKKRTQKLRAYAEKVRKRLEERENYLQNRIKSRDKKLDEWRKKREESLKGKKQTETPAEISETTPKEAPSAPETAPESTEPVESAPSEEGQEIQKTEESKEKESKEAAEPAEPAETKEESK